MVKVQHFSAENIRQNVQHVGERAAQYKEALRQAQGEIPSEISEREVVKEALKYEPISPSQASPSVSAQSDGDQEDGAVSLLPDYFAGGDEEGMKEAVERLAQSALKGDLKHSLKEARKLTPYLEDAFHDALVDKVLPEMKKRGLL